MGLRGFIDWNRKLSHRLDTRLDTKARRIDGCGDFLAVVQAYLRRGMTVLDIGGGKTPVIPLELKASYRLRIVGMDISQEELNAAPPGCYDQAICGDVSTATRLPEADLAVCRSVTEHVREPGAMYANLYRALVSGGVSINFMPNKFAPFALLNAAVPNRIAKPIADFFYPQMKGGQGFPAYYRRCYPSAMGRLLRKTGFEKVEFRLYYRSEYLSFFLPLHACELTYQLLTSRIGLPNLCETFTVIARKPQHLVKL